jgi:hypothetical protein
LDILLVAVEHESSSPFLGFLGREMDTMGWQECVMEVGGHLLLCWSSCEILAI